MNYSYLRRLLLLLFPFFLLNCSSRKDSRYSEKVGFDFSKKQNGGLDKYSEKSIQKTPPGMVLIRGGSFLMSVGDPDVMGSNVNNPSEIHVDDFYMDESEVTNKDYAVYLEWLEKVFPKEDEKYKHIYTGALPDTTVWVQALGSNNYLTKTYLRHYSYQDYPVVGVSWLQANDYCKWRTDRIVEKKLVDEQVMKPLYTNDSVIVMGKNRFDVEVFEVDPRFLFDGNLSIYTEKSLVTPSPDKNAKEGNDGATDAEGDQKSDVKLRIDRRSVVPHVRLATEVEWEYAARADEGNRYYNTIVGRKKYVWHGSDTRNSRSKYYVQYANFKNKRGDYKGIPGWDSDYGSITSPVRSFPPNIFGLYDMAGNVCEWVFDVYSPIINNEVNDFGYVNGAVYEEPKLDASGKPMIYDHTSMEYDTLPNGKIRAKMLPGGLIKKRNDSIDANIKRELAVTENPFDGDKKISLVTERSRIYKGGSWKDIEFWLQPGQRRFLQEYESNSTIGFRCVVDKIGGEIDKNAPRKRLFKKS